MNLRYIILSFGIIGLTLYGLTHIPRGAETTRSYNQEVATGSVYEDLIKNAPTVRGASVIPARPTYQTDGCTWVWNRVLSVGVWSEQCTVLGAVWKLSPLSSGEGNGLAHTIAGVKKFTALQLFPKGKTQTIDSLLPELRRYGTPAEDCVFVKNDAQSIATRTVYELTPTGARKKTFDMQSQTGTPDDQCGDYGVSAEGQRVFEIWSGHEDTVFFLNYGHESSLFEYETLSFL